MQDEEKDKAVEDETPDTRKEAETRPSPSPTPAKVKNKQTAVEPNPNPSQELKSDKADGIAPVLPPIASPSANAGKVPEGIPGAIMRGDG